MRVKLSFNLDIFIYGRKMCTGIASILQEIGPILAALNILA